MLHLYSTCLTTFIQVPPLAWKWWIGKPEKSPKLVLSTFCEYSVDQHFDENVKPNCFCGWFVGQTEVGQGRRRDNSPALVDNTLFSEKYFSQISFQTSFSPKYVESEPFLAKEKWAKVDKDTTHQLSTCFPSSQNLLQNLTK